MAENTEKKCNGLKDLNGKKRVNLQRIRDHAKVLQDELMDKMNADLRDMFETFVTEVEYIEQNGEQNISLGQKEHERKKRGELPDKVFVARRSVLSELLEVNHIQTIFHIFVAMLILFSLNTIVYDIIDKGRIGLDFEMITWGFGKFPHVITMWLVMKLSTILVVYPSFHYWSSLRSPIRTFQYDIAWLVLYIVYQCAFMVIPVKYLLEHELPPASTVVIIMEQIRLLMKTHSFIRENAYKIIAYQAKKKDDSECNDQPNPDFSKFLYFLFAPTLIYRDSYPRTQHVNWNYVVTNLVQVLACLFYTYYIFARFCVPVFRNFNQEHVTPKRVILTVFASMLPGTLVLLIGFFGILHSWFNAFAEMLRFADRLFYKDWWNSTTYANFYRSWNGVVHDWLYTYIFKDCSLLLAENNRIVARALVFIVSALFHEYVITISLGFFYPVLFFMFVVGGGSCLTLRGTSRTWNIIIWVGLFIGNGMLMCLYSMEWYARRSCPVFTDNFLDYLIPRSWICDFTDHNITST